MAWFSEWLILWIDWFCELIVWFCELIVWFSDFGSWIWLHCVQQCVDNNLIHWIFNHWKETERLGTSRTSGKKSTELCFTSIRFVCTWARHTDGGQIPSSSFFCFYFFFGRYVWWFGVFCLSTFDTFEILGPCRSFN
jgi:hypothetical protein